MTAAELEAVYEYRIQQAETSLLDKASKKDLESVVERLEGIQKTLNWLLLAVVGGSIGFGFAALQIASSVSGG